MPIYSGSRLNPSWFALGTSRGIETPESKTFMRVTVLVLDALIYIPALVMFVKAWQGTRSIRTQVKCAEFLLPHQITKCYLQNLALLILLLQPALLLIDFGHFQYNSVMLGELHSYLFFNHLTPPVGFTLLAMNLFATGHDVLGALCFVLSLGFKQMALYYAPAIGSYLLGKCLYLGTSQGYEWTTLREYFYH